MRGIAGAGIQVLELRTDGGSRISDHGDERSPKTRRKALIVCEPYSPQHSLAAERLNLELEEKIRVNLVF